MGPASLTPTDEARLRACYRRLLRRVLDIKTTSYTKVLDPTATTMRNDEFNPQDKLITALRRQRAKLAARTLALPQDHHVRAVALTDCLTYRRLHNLTNTRGKPRSSWHDAAYTDLWTALHKDVAAHLYHLRLQSTPPDHPPPPQPTFHYRPYNYPTDLIGLHKLVTAVGCKAVERGIARGFDYSA